MMPSFRSLASVIAFAVVYAAVSLSITNSYYQLVMTLVLVWAVFGLSWNLLSGYTGLISFGHAAFFGIGAYTTALGQIYFDLSPWLLIPIAAMLGGLAGLLVGFPTFRLQGHYFALAMLAYPLAILYVFEWLGFQEVTLPIKRDNPFAYMQFSDGRAYTVLALGMLIGTILLSQWIERSRFGMALLAIKQNEAAAEAAGINTLVWKLRAITLSGAIAGAIGAFYAIVLLVVTPQSVFGMLVSAQALTVAMFGGVGTVWGPVIGSVILIPLAEGLNAEVRHAFSRNPGRHLWPCDHLRDPCRAGRAVLEGARPPAEAARRRFPRAGIGTRDFRSTTSTRDCCVVSGRSGESGGAAGYRPRSARPIALLRWIAGRAGCQLPAAPKFHPWNHRAQRRRQDHPVQSDERLPAARRR